MGYQNDKGINRYAIRNVEKQMRLLTWQHKTRTKVEEAIKTREDGGEMLQAKGVNSNGEPRYFCTVSRRND